MDCAAVQIAQLAGALRMLRIIVYDRSVCQFRWKLGRQSLITHIKTFAAHYCWRFLPSVVHILPGLLVGSEVGRCDLKLCCSISLLAPGGLHLPVFESAKFLPDTAAGLGIFILFDSFAFSAIAIVWFVVFPAGLRFKSHRLQELNHCFAGVTVQRSLSPYLEPRPASLDYQSRCQDVKIHGFASARNLDALNIDPRGTTRLARSSSG